MDAVPPHSPPELAPGPPRPFAPSAPTAARSSQPVLSVEANWVQREISDGRSDGIPAHSNSWSYSRPRRNSSKRSSLKCEKHLAGVMQEESLKRYINMPLALPHHGQGGQRLSVDNFSDAPELTSSAQVGAAFWASELPQMTNSENKNMGESSMTSAGFVEDPDKGWNQTMSKLLQASSFSLLVGFAYVALVFIFEAKQFLPFDSFFAIAVLWAGSMTGAQIAKLARLPQLLGMLCSGIIVKNCGDLSRDLPESWAATIRAFGLMNILIRGGLEMDVGAVKRVGMAVVRLTVVPGVSEAFAVAALATPIIGCPFFLALATGFIIAAVSPAVVVGGMFNLQALGYGVKKGIPSLVVAAASFDDVVAISGFSMCIGLAIGEGNIIIEALHGPINIVGGILCGVLGAIILAATKLWDLRWKRSLALLLLGVIFTFSSKLAHFAGAGALASLVMAATSAHFWAQGTFAFMSAGPDDNAAHDTEADMCRVWKLAAEPLLFSVIGSALDFRQIDISTIPKAIGIILGGVCVRTIGALLATYGAGLSWKERSFIALAWMPKATVQAALGSVPLDMVRKNLKREDDPEKFDRFEQYGIAILTTAVFSILMTAPVGLIVIQKLGPRWLERFCEGDVEEGVEEEEASDEKLEDSREPLAIVPGGRQQEPVTEVAIRSQRAGSVTSVQVVEIDGADLAAGAGAGM